MFLDDFMFLFYPFSSISLIQIIIYDDLPFEHTHQITFLTFIKVIFFPNIQQADYCAFIRE